MKQLVQYRSLVQSFFGEVSLVLEVDSDISIAHFSTVEYYSNLSDSIMSCQIVYSARLAGTAVVSKARGFSAKFYPTNQQGPPDSTIHFSPPKTTSISSKFF
jgi:hypothetical protein